MLGKSLSLIALCSAGALLLDSPFLFSTPNRIANPTPEVRTAVPDSSPVPDTEKEAQYVQEVREWLETLPQKTQSRVRQIMREAHPELVELRTAIREKKTELATLSFTRGSTPATLPRLGLELQTLRDTLAARLQTLRKRLSEEASIDLAKIHKDAFWLPLPPDPKKN